SGGVAPKGEREAGTKKQRRLALPEHQFFNRPRLQELHNKEQALHLKRQARLAFVKELRAGRKAAVGQLTEGEAPEDVARQLEEEVTDGRFELAPEELVAGHKNPLQTLTLNYYGGIGKQQQGRLWTDEEDTFLLILMHKFEYGNWERIRMEIRKSEKFCFDWFFKSRTSFELNKRGDTLIKLIEREEAEADGRKPFPSLSHHKRKREVEEGGGEEEEEEEEEVEEEDEMEMDDDELEEEEDEEDEEESRGQEEQSLTSESVSSSTRNTGRLRQSRGGAGSKKTKH
ncbi:snf2 super family, partial [Nannochloropsis oceanica]